MISPVVRCARVGAAPASSMRKHSPLVNTHRRVLFLRDAMETSDCEEILPTNQTLEMRTLKKWHTVEDRCARLYAGSPTARKQQTALPPLHRAPMFTRTTRRATQQLLQRRAM